MSSMNMADLEKILFTVALVGYTISMAVYLSYILTKKESPLTGGKLVLAAAFAVHTAALIMRTIASGHAPFTNQYEFASCFAWGITGCYLAFQKRFRLQVMGIVVMPIAVLMMGYAAMQNKEISTLMPALQSNWLVIHVLSAIIAYGAFAVACATAAFYLLYEKLAQTMGNKMLSKEQLDTYTYRLVSFGFIFLTFVMICGAIWAQQAWGSYWSWDPKETWSLITWIIYAIFLHLRIGRGMRGNKAAWFAMIGFICVIFTYIGVNILLPGLHSYA